jgi:hypothetical protein
VYGDRNDVVTPYGWTIQPGGLGPGWWRVRARGCCLTDADTGLGTYWPWSPWREFRVLLPLNPGIAKGIGPIGGGGSMLGPTPPGSSPRSQSAAVQSEGDRSRLVVRAIAPEPASPTAGQPLRLAITVVNEGTAAAQGPIWIGCSAPGGGACPFPASARSLRAPLGPKERQIIVFDGPPLGPGRYEIKAGPDRTLGTEALRIELTVPAASRTTPAPRRAP